MRDEVFKGTEVKGAHRTGSELAAAAILGYAALAYCLYTWDLNLVTGSLLGKDQNLAIVYVKQRSRPGSSDSSSGIEAVAAKSMQALRHMRGPWSVQESDL